MKWQVAVLALLGIFKPLAACARSDDFEQEPVLYSKSTPSNVIERLNRRLKLGAERLEFEATTGFLKSVLHALHVDSESQMLVFSKTSLQRNRISPAHPRAIYFNDEVYLGFCRDGDVIEASAVDPNLGAVFYTLDQKPTAVPQFVRQGESCLICHANSQTGNIPGHVIRSLIPDWRGHPMLAGGSRHVDHSTPIKDRWGGWYVTGTHGSMSHLGNFFVHGRELPPVIDNTAGQNLREVPKTADLDGYPSRHSDIAALMVFEHQAKGHNLIAEATIRTRIALDRNRRLNVETGQPADHLWDMTSVQLNGLSDRLVRYLLFCDEAPLSSPIEGTSGFAAAFSRSGRQLANGRSLRQLDLRKRLFKRPLSYLINTEAFEGMPIEMRTMVWTKIARVLSGDDQSKSFDHLSPLDRRELSAILAELKPELMTQAALPTSTSAGSAMRRTVE